MKFVKWLNLSIVGFLAFVFFNNSFLLQASDGLGIRERIIKRIRDKNNEKPAPEVTAKMDETLKKPGTYTLSFKHDDIDRYYMIHIPPSYDGKKAFPLVLSFHGGAGNMAFQASNDTYALTEKADKEGFVIIYPNGYSQFKAGTLATWNAGGCCAEARDKKIDDVGFIRKIIQSTFKQMSIDQKRVFATGMSNGGMMSYRLACELSDLLKGIAAVAGTDNTLECAPKNSISILHIHAKDDDHVQFNGGAGKGAFEDKSKIMDFKSVPETIQKWVKLNKCKAEAKKTLEIKGAYCEAYLSCERGTQVQLCVTEEGGHSWPGSKKRGLLSKYNPSQAISANDIIFEFFNKISQK